MVECRHKEVEKFLRNIYNLAFFRDPDIDGLSTYREEINIPEQDLKIINSFVEKILHSSERQSIEDRSSRSFIYEEDRFQDVAFPEIISIGQHCVTSATIKSFGWKRNSYPFDWIFSSIPMVNHCIKNKFDNFLDRNYFEPIPLYERENKDANFCNHTFYKKEFGINFLFNHLDPTEDKNYDYYTRCVKRLLNIFKENKRKIFIGFVSGDFSNEAHALAETISQFSMSSELYIFEFRPTNRFFPHVSRIEKMSNGCYFSVETISGLEAVEIPNRFDRAFVHGIISNIIRHGNKTMSFP